VTTAETTDVQELIIDACERSLDGEDFAVEADMGEMGLLRVTVDRHAGGIRVSLTTDNAASATTLESQSGALLGLLQRGGFPVTGLNVELGGERGTGVARRREGGGGSRTAKGFVHGPSMVDNSPTRAKDSRTRVDVFA
jgi:hypothetical protein